MTENDKDANLLAGLCYIPFALINIIVILYVLLAKKGGKFARFHALQSLFTLLVIVVISGIVNLVFFFPTFLNFYANFFTLQSSEAFMATWVQMFSMMLIPLAISILFMLVFIIFTMLAFMGKKFRIPLIANLVDKVA